MDGVQFSNPNTSCVGLRSMDIYIVIYIFRYYVFKCQCIEIYSAMTVVIGGSMLANLAAGQNLDTLFDLLKRSRYMVLVLKVLTHLPYMGTSGIGAGVHSSLDHLIRIISADSLPRGGFQPPPCSKDGTCRTPSTSSGQTGERTVSCLESQTLGIQSYRTSEGTTGPDVLAPTVRVSNTSPYLRFGTTGSLGKVLTENGCN